VTPHPISAATSGGTPSGIGTAAERTASGLSLGALVAVNCFGEVVDPDSGRVVAGPRGEKPGAFEDTLAVLRTRPPLSPFATGPNSTIGVVATDAVLTKEDAFDLGASGPTARASGVDWDLRRDLPYSGYDQFRFDVPVRHEGDVYARYLVRVAEIRESVKIVHQAMDGMPEGPVMAEKKGVILPQREKMKTEMEALIYHFKIVTEGFRVPVGEVYQAVESPRGEMGYYVVSDGTSHPYRVKVRSPSFANLQALPKIAEGRMIADLVACIGSIDIVLGEIDR